MPPTLPLVFAGTALALLGCAPPYNKCLDWVEDGKTYTITLGQPVTEPDAVADNGSCGSSFDVGTGDAITLEATSAPYNPICSPVQAKPGPIPNVIVVDPRPQSVGFIRPDLGADLSRVTVGDGCYGWYAIGVTGEWHSLFAYRVFGTGTPADCMTPGSTLNAEHTICVDTWKVKVEDSHGNVVADSTP